MADESFDDVTEIFDLNVTRQDAVGLAASGWPVLMMKSLAAKDAPVAAAPDASGCGCCPNCSMGVTKGADTPKETEVPDTSTQADNTQKDAPQEGATAPETPAAETAEPVDKSVDEKIADAIAEVTKAAEKRVEALKAELDELKAKPIPGQVALAAAPTARDTARKGELLKAKAYLARQVQLTQNDRETSQFYESELKSVEKALEDLS